MSSMSKQKKTGIIIAIVAVVLVIAALVCWAAFRPKALEGVKEITVNVTHNDGTVYTEEIRTTEQYLSGALGDLIDGEDTEYGMFVTVVDGETADGTNGAYWMFDVNGEMGEYGVDSQPITDGDTYDFYIIVY